MKELLPRRLLSEELRQLSYACLRQGAKFSDLFEILSVRGHALIIFFFSAPFFVPILIPGLSLVVGPIIFLLGLMMALGKSPWVPKSLLRLGCDSKLLAKFLRFASRIMAKVEKLARPRGKFLLRIPWIGRFNGAVIAFCGFLLALPLPPGTNVPPALGALLISMGMLEDDGLFVGLGYFVTALTTVLFAAGMFFGFEGLIYLYRRWI